MMVPGLPPFARRYFLALMLLCIPPVGCGEPVEDHLPVPVLAAPMTLVDDFSNGGRKITIGRAGSRSWSSRRVKLPLHRIKNIPQSMKNYGYGSQIEDYKNMPIYFTHATLASLALSMLSKWWDPTYTIAAINLIIWNGWQMANEDHLLLRFMNDNFLLHREPAEHFKPRQVLLHGFSHFDDAHISSNLGCLLSVGPLVRRYTTWSVFSYTSFYVASLYVSSVFDEVVYVPLMRTFGPKSKESFFSRFLPKQSSSLGASGAVSAVITFCGLTCPHEKIEIDDEMESSDVSDTEPMSMWIIALSAFLSDVILPLTAEGKQSNIGHGAQLGEACLGPQYTLSTACGVLSCTSLCRSRLHVSRN